MQGGRVCMFDFQKSKVVLSHQVLVSRAVQPRFGPRAGRVSVERKEGLTASALRASWRNKHKIAARDEYYS